MAKQTDKTSKKAAAPAKAKAPAPAKAAPAKAAPAKAAPKQAPGEQPATSKPSKRKATKEQKARSKQSRARQTACEPETSRSSLRTRVQATSTSHSELGEKLIGGVPARIMRPRLVFIFCLVAICAFGLLMVYSASAVESLKENGSPYHYFFRQAIFMTIGTLLVFAITWRGFPWSLSRIFSFPFWLGVLVLLAAVLFIGTGGESWGASRWIPLPFFNLQPAELAKPAVILIMADLFAKYFEDQTISGTFFALSLFSILGLTLLLIVVEPDLGTTVIIFGAVFIMLFVSGLSLRLTAAAVVAALLLIVGLIIIAPYRFNRFIIALNPWSDPYGLGYQATLAIMAFASGGAFGRGIGNSTLKYNYLPEAHNDYILAIIGEEIGFVGTIVFILVFLLMIYAAYKIASRAATYHAQMVALGCGLVLGIQFFINVLGVLGPLPMTGKPLPFVSYGGSSIVCALIMAGLIIRVSLESNVETAADRRRSSMSVMREDDEVDVSSHLGRSTAGKPHKRSDRSRRAEGSSNERASVFRVLNGGRTSEPAPRGGRGRVRRDEPYERIDLGEEGSERLRRGASRTRVDYSDITGPGRPRRSGDDRSRPSSRGNRYDR